LTIKRIINNWFDCLFKQSRNANVEKIIELSEVLQFDEDFAFLSENRDNQTNQCNNIQSWIERNCSLDEENRIDIESY
jgi:hypothetical protein